MKRLLILLLVLTCLMSSGCLSGSEEDQVKDIIREYYSAYNDRDAETIVDLFADDLIEEGGGRETIIENLQIVFSLADETGLELKIVRFLNIRFLNNTAIVNFDVNLKDVDRDTQANLTFKLTKEDDTWKILEMIEE
ncbi:MAG TPA: DUF4440 domain-containing protein [Candidatus Methanofastidiosa archaeon]|nr:DUF4440 domain-containing protein [Candidatus Methanofastidiosa archaeon]